jgi:hypothetical protein
MAKFVVGVCLILAASAGEAGPADLSIRIEVPHQLAFEGPFTVRIVVSNVGQEALVFKRHWKWAENTMFLEVEGPSGEVRRSSPALFDIPVAAMCSFFVPLYPGDVFSTAAVFNGNWPPTVDFTKPGKYRLRLIYVSDARSKEQGCSHGGVPIWLGRISSEWTEFEVVAP